MPLPEAFLQELKMRSDIVDVVSSYVSLRRSGRNMVGLCPFHHEKTPSFNVYAENGSFYCFGCGVGGDVITFIRRIENLDYMEAVRFLAQRAGLQPSRFALVDFLAKKGYQEAEMIQANVAFKGRSGRALDRFFGRVMYPIIDLRGNVIAFGGRVLTDAKPKYLNTSDTLVFLKSDARLARIFAKVTPCLRSI